MTIFQMHFLHNSATATNIFEHLLFACTVLGSADRKGKAQELINLDFFKTFNQEIQSQLYSLYLLLDSQLFHYLCWSQNLFLKKKKPVNNSSNNKIREEIQMIFWKEMLLK